MAKAKHPKSKPSKQAKQPLSKKRGGKQNDISELRTQLDVLGLKIIQVTADGNCFFRALSDQLEGDEDEHEKYRSMVVGFIKNNREMFEPFVEDEVPFDEYCRTMGEDGTWAGHMELQAASLVTRCNICIHRRMSPRWYIQNFDKHEARMIHLSYHDGEHYNSVRSKDDTCSGPARPIVIKGDADLSAKPTQPKAATKKSKEGGGENDAYQDSIKLVKAGSGCEDAKKVEQALQQVGGDVDAAVEVLIAEQESLDQIVAHDEVSHSEKNSSDEHQDENSEQHKLKVEDETCKQDLSGNDTKRNNKKNSLRPDEKKISRNKNCPCGSKKKYKSCCGSVAGKSSVRLPVNQTVDYGKSRKEKKQGRKGGSTVENLIQSDGKPLDMGALCI
ncbi:hypothetical protein BUALT_Bualt04G0109700 [Buddleja alternifolia]|uniref:OTU domain-containing protein n=1 Tax=Buddleja alternifolia TaxID=168488 RepID=A0AAV6XUF2_9LAMI|nr:hypothetical protein BUALT_Bualt04G0109700 [Buddleja alternifolia]